MEIHQIIEAIKSHNIDMTVTPTFDLRVSAKSEVLSSECLEFIKEHKLAIIDQICSYKSQEMIFRIPDPDDIEFVVKQVQHIFGRERLETVERYLEETEKGFETESNVIKKRNAGRRRANTWIKELLIGDNDER